MLITLFVQGSKCKEEYLQKMSYCAFTRTNSVNTYKGYVGLLDLLGAIFNDLGSKVVYGCISCGSARAIPAPSIGSTPSNNSMDNIQVEGEIPSVSAKPKQKRQKFFKLPLSAQPDAGHVIFRGNDMIVDFLEESESS